MKELFSKTLFAEGWLKYWAIYIMAFPFYLSPAGTIQLGDIFFIVVLAVYIVREGIFYKKEFAPQVKNFRNLLIYICIVNFGLFIARTGYVHDRGLPWYFTNAFYIYNFLVFCFCLSLFTRYKKEFIYTTVYSLVFTALLQLTLSPFGHTNEGRQTLFFINPNQLGYYSLGSLTIILALERYLKLSRLIIFISFALFFYFTMLCVSKAAIGGMIILFFVYVISNKIFKLKTMVTAVLVLGGLAVALFSTRMGEQFLTNLNNRMSNSVKPTDVSEFAYRGYDRMVNHPEYMILGAGEGAYNRFDTFIENHEMHSSLGTILFCYGIPGSVLFIIFILRLLKGLPFSYRIYMIPLIAYGVAHMGLRFTIFYIALAVFPIAKGLSATQETEPEAAPAKTTRRKRTIRPLWQMHPQQFK